jgi:hypothetical protein
MRKEVGDEGGNGSLPARVAATAGSAASSPGAIVKSGVQEPDQAAT